MDTAETLLGDLVTAMSALGAPCYYGCAQDALDYWTEYAHGLQTGKRLVAVKGWCWWDLEFPWQLRKKIDVLFLWLDIQPAYLWANEVIFDTSRRFQPGSWVRTTALLKLHEHCIFETRNSLYLLVGTGSRTSVDIALADSLM